MPYGYRSYQKEKKPTFINRSLDTSFT